VGSRPPSVELGSTELLRPGGQSYVPPMSVSPPACWIIPVKAPVPLTLRDLASGQWLPSGAAPFENEIRIASASIIASSDDRSMTVREWDPVLQRSAWGYGPYRAPLPDSHGSVNWRRLLRFLVVEASAQSHPQEALAPFEKETSGFWGFVRHCVGKSCPALSSEPGLIFLTAQVVRSSVGLGFVTLVIHPLAAPSEDRRRSDVQTNS